MNNKGDHQAERSEDQNDEEIRITRQLAKRLRRLQKTKENRLAKMVKSMNEKEAFLFQLGLISKESKYMKENCTRKDLMVHEVKKNNKKPKLIQEKPVKVKSEQEKPVKVKSAQKKPVEIVEKKENIPKQESRKVKKERF